MSNNPDALERKVNIAKLLLLKKKHFAFISTMLYKLQYQASTEVSTMAYDGSESTIYLNPEWFLELSDQEACSALAHEALHYALQHDMRMGRKDPALFNQAADHVVNNILMDYGFELPVDVPVDRRFQNKTTEHVYKMLQDEKQNNQNDQDDSQGQNNSNQGTGGGGGQSPFGNDIRPNQNPSVQQQSRRNREVLNANQNDANTQKQQGSKSQGLGNEAFDELFEDIKTGRKPWQDILIEYINEKVKGDRSWAALDRRMLSLGYYMPAQEDDTAIDQIAIAIDISGSVSQEQIDYFLQETRAVKNICNPDKLNVVSFNTRITGQWTFERDEPLETIQMKISGGTDLQDVWKHYAKPENAPNFLLVFSDMWVDIPDKPKYDVIWCVVDNPEWQPPYGKAIYINEEDYAK